MAVGCCCNVVQLMLETFHSLVNSYIPSDQNGTFANSVDSNGMALNELSHQDLHCLPFRF